MSARSPRTFPATRFLSLFSVCVFCLGAALFGQSYVINNARIVTVSGPVIEGGSIVIQDGRIADVGKKVVIPAGAKIIDARGLSVYPGAIDLNTSVGLTEIGSVSATVDTTEIGEFNPHLLAYTAIQPASEHIPVVRANGVTTVVSAPSGGTLSGQAVLINLDGWTVEEMAVKKSAGMVLNFPTVTARLGFGGGGGGGFGAPRRGYAELKREYDRRIKELENLLDKARHYAKATEARSSNAALPAFDTDLKLKALAPVVRGELPLLVHVSRVGDIRNAIDFAEKQKLKIVLIGVRDAGKAISILKDKKIPVVYGPVQALPTHEDDAYDLPYSTPGLLAKAGIPFAISTSGEVGFVRNLLYEAGTAAAFGLSKEEALKAITLYPAQILGVSDRLGSIEKGKIANLVVTDGDLLELRTNVKQVFIAGKPVSLETRHTRLYEKYLNRP